MQTSYPTSASNIAKKMPPTLVVTTPLVAPPVQVARDENETQRCQQRQAYREGTCHDGKARFARIFWGEGI